MATEGDAIVAFVAASTTASGWVVHASSEGEIGPVPRFATSGAEVMLAVLSSCRMKESANELCPAVEPSVLPLEIELGGGAATECPSENLIAGAPLCALSVPEPPRAAVYRLRDDAWDGPLLPVPSILSSIHIRRTQ